MMVHYNFPTQVSFGPGARHEVAGLLKKYKVERPLVVTDKGLSALPMTAELMAQLSSNGFDAALYDGIEGNPVGDQIRAGADKAKEHRCDAVVALGGGASLDSAKLIALMVHHPGDIFEYDCNRDDMRPIDQKMPLLIAIPTTAGTGSEVGRAAVVSDDKSHQKIVMFDPKLLPNEVVADPELCLGLPASVTAATGMDAITHLVEAYISNGYHPLCDGIAREGLKLAARALPVATDFARRLAAGETLLEEQNAMHLWARADMLNAALMGAVAFQKGLGVTHSCAHALSTVCDLHHGLANAIMIPYCMKFNAASCEDRLCDLAREVGALEASAEGFVSWLFSLNESLGLPTKLNEVGVKLEHLDDLVKFAMADGCHLENPCPVTQKDFESIYGEALS